MHKVQGKNERKLTSLADFEPEICYAIWTRLMSLLQQSLTCKISRGMCTYKYTLGNLIHNCSPSIAGGSKCGLIAAIHY